MTVRSADVDALPAIAGAFDSERIATLQASASRHLWPHFTPPGQVSSGVPIFVRGEGVEVFEASGKRWLDGLAALFTVQVGHGRKDMLAAAFEASADLPYFPVWSAAQVPAIELAERLAHLAPGDLNRVFFGTGGGDSVESAWKLARQYFQQIGKPRKYKVLSRVGAYHGTSLGALSLTAMKGIRQPFEPLVPGSVKVPNTNIYRARVLGDDPVAFGRLCADAIEDAILAEDPETVAAIYLEPVQNAGGSYVPPPGYLERVREICDTYDVLYVSDETICGFGRLGTMFGCQRFGVQPDIITCAKGLTSGYAVISAVIASDRIYEAFASTGTAFSHGNTWGGHPVAAAVALANLDIFDNENLLAHAQANEAAFEQTLRRLEDLPVVGDVRGAGHLWAIELVKDRATKEPINTGPDGAEAQRRIAEAITEAGLYCRMFGGGSPLIQLCPPLISGQDTFDEIESILRGAIGAGMAAL